MSDERPAQQGELCTCGHPAVVVYSNETFGEHGETAVRAPPGTPQYPTSPCGARFPHKTSWGYSEKCPDYALRPPAR